MLNFNCNIAVKFNLLNEHPNDISLIRIRCLIQQFDNHEKTKLIFYKSFMINFNELEFSIENDKFNSFINNKIDENFTTEKINEFSKCNFIPEFKSKLESFIYSEGIV